MPTGFGDLAIEATGLGRDSIETHVAAATSKKQNASSFHRFLKKSYFFLLEMFLLFPTFSDRNNSKTRCPPALETLQLKRLAWAGILLRPTWRQRHQRNKTPQASIDSSKSPTFSYLRCSFFFLLFPTATTQKLDAHRLWRPCN